MTYTVPRKGRKGSVIGINSTTLLFPYNAASSSTAWKYGVIHAVYVESPPGVTVQILVRDAADTTTLVAFELTSSGAHPGAYHVHMPIEQPWGVKLSAADGSAAISFEQIV